MEDNSKVMFAFIICGIIIILLILGYGYGIYYPQKIARTSKIFDFLYFNENIRIKEGSISSPIMIEIVNEREFEFKILEFSSESRVTVYWKQTSHYMGNVPQDYTFYLPDPNNINITYYLVIG